MSIFSFFKPKRTAPAARERLQLLLAHERVAGSDNRLIAVLQEEILAVIARHMQIDRDKVKVKLGRDEDVNTLEIDIEMPARVRALKQGRRPRLTTGPAAHSRRLEPTLALIACPPASHPAKPLPNR